MKNRDILILIMLFALSVAGCKKSSTAADDLAAKANGTYSGTYTASGVASFQGSVEITKQAGTVNMVFLAKGQTLAFVSGVQVIDGGGGTVNLLDSFQGISGTVNGNSLDCYYSPWHFTGTKH
jgi:hypothetical protein